MLPINICFVRLVCSNMLFKTLYWRKKRWRMPKIIFKVFRQLSDTFTLRLPSSNIISQMNTFTFFLTLNSWKHSVKLSSPHYQGVRWNFKLSFHSRMCFPCSNLNVIVYTKRESVIILTTNIAWIPFPPFQHVHTVLAINHKWFNPPVVFTSTMQFLTPWVKIDPGWFDCFFSQLHSKFLP